MRGTTDGVPFPVLSTIVQMSYIDRRSGGSNPAQPISPFCNVTDLNQGSSTRFVNACLQARRESRGFSEGAYWWESPSQDVRRARSVSYTPLDKRHYARETSLSQPRKARQGTHELETMRCIHGGPKCRFDGRLEIVAVSHIDQGE